MPIYDRFEPTLRRTVPNGGWVLDSTQAAAVRMLQLHGVRVERFDEPAQGELELFRADSIVRSPRPFQGHNEVRLEGSWLTLRALK